MVITVNFPGTGMTVDVPEHHPNPLMNPHIAAVVLEQTINWVIYFENTEEHAIRLADDRIVLAMHVYIGFYNNHRIVVQRPITVLPPNGKVELLKDVDVAHALKPLYANTENFKKDLENGASGWRLKNPAFSSYDGVTIFPMDQDELNARIKDAVALGVDEEEFDRTDFYYVIPSARADEIERMVLDNEYTIQSTLVH